MAAIDKRRDSLWPIIAGPTVWAVYFLLCYIVAAVHCAKLSHFGVSLADARVTIAAFTVIALALIGHAGFRAFQQWGFETADPPLDDDTREDRRRFLGFATLLLCGLSLIATIYVALPTLIISTCR